MKLKTKEPTPVEDRPYPEGIAWDEAWRQRRMKRKYREALKKIANLYWKDAPYPQEMREIAKEALEANYGG